MAVQGSHSRIKLFFLLVLQHFVGGFCPHGLTMTVVLPDIISTFLSEREEKKGGRAEALFP